MASPPGGDLIKWLVYWLDLSFEKVLAHPPGCREGGGRVIIAISFALIKWHKNRWTEQGHHDDHLPATVANLADVVGEGGGRRRVTLAPQTPPLLLRTLLLIIVTLFVLSLPLLLLLLPLQLLLLLLLPPLLLFLLQLPPRLLLAPPLPLLAAHRSHCRTNQWSWNMVCDFSALWRLCWIGCKEVNRDIFRKGTLRKVEGYIWKGIFRRRAYLERRILYQLWWTLPDEHFSPPPSPSPTPCCNRNHQVKIFRCWYLQPICIVSIGYWCIPGSGYWALGLSIGYCYWVLAFDTEH